MTRCRLQGRRLLGGLLLSMWKGSRVLDSRGRSQRVWLYTSAGRWSQATAMVLKTGQAGKPIDRGRLVKLQRPQALLPVGRSIRQ